MKRIGDIKKRKYQVFLSSTYEDLIEERNEVIQALLENDCIPTGMELFPASNKKQWDIIKKVIDDSDYYLLIISGRYGSCGKDDYGHIVGYTEMEYDYAYRMGKPIIVFLHSDIESLPLNKSEKTKIGRQRLNKFRKKVSNGREIAYWTNKDNLKAKVILAIRAVISDYPSGGWIKAENVSEETLTNSSEDAENSFKDIYNELYFVLVDIREAIRNGDSMRINESVSKAESRLRKIYYKAEFYRYSKKDEVNKANTIINQWNSFSRYYNAFVNAPDRMIAEAQYNGKKAEEKFNMLVDLVVKNL